MPKFISSRFCGREHKYRSFLAQDQATSNSSQIGNKSMRLRFRWHVVNLAVFCAVMHETAFAATDPSELAKRAIADFKASSAVERVEINTAELRHYSYNVYFKSGQGTVALARSETGKLLGKTLQLLVSSGASPSTEWIIVRARGYEQMQGLTGKRLVRDFGVSRYDYSLDSIEFRPPQ